MQTQIRSDGQSWPCLFIASFLPLLRVVKSCIKKGNYLNCTQTCQKQSRAEQPREERYLQARQLWLLHKLAMHPSRSYWVSLSLVFLESTVGMAASASLGSAGRVKGVQRSPGKSCSLEATREPPESSGKHWEPEVFMSQSQAWPLSFLFQSKLARHAQTEVSQCRRL